MQAMLSAEKHRRPSLALLPRQRRRALRARMAWVAAAVGGGTARNLVWSESRTPNGEDGGEQARPKGEPRRADRWTDPH